MAFVAAVFEETLFRGFLFRLTALASGNWRAIAVTSALFGFGHISNPHATPISSAAIAIEAGILLGAASGSLWLPIGIHAAWNFTEGSVFGMAFSGNTMRPGWVTGTLNGPAILTGRTFGPEASAVAVAVCLVPAVFYLRMIGKRAPVNVRDESPVTLHNASS